MSDAQIQDDNPTPSPEELKQEEEALEVSNEDTVRSQIIEKYGLDEIDNEDLIDSLTSDTLEQRKSFGKVVQQKRTWREKATTAPPVEPTEPTVEPVVPQPTDISQAVSAELEARDLSGLDVSEELRDKVKSYANLEGVSIKAAVDSDYIQHFKTVEDEQRKTDEASLGGKTKGSSRTDYGDKSPSDFDATTEEGQKGWEEYKANLNKTQP